MSNTPQFIDGHSFIPYVSELLSSEEAQSRGEAFRDTLSRRRSVRDFATTPVPRRLLELAIQAASTAPSGANQQPYTFVAVSEPSIKRQIRERAEQEERRNYEGGRLPPEWREAIAHLGTNSNKSFLETAPWLVVLFMQRHGVHQDGSSFKHYYPKESTGLAAGMFIAALHQMGLATLTHTPSPMHFLGEVLNRPSAESAFLLFPVGYPAEGCLVPDQTRKSLDEISVWMEATSDDG